MTTQTDPDLTLEDVERLETHHREGVYLAAQSIEQLLSIARAHIEGREQVGELVERLRKRGKYVIEEGTHPNPWQADSLCQEAANALTAMQAENERLREALEIDPYSERWDKIVEEGYADYCKSKSGAKGQLITPMDAPEYWICKAFARAALGKEGE